MAIKSDAIGKVIKESGNIRPTHERATGICFGFSFIVLMALFARKLDVFEKNFNAIDSSLILPSTSQAPKHISTLANGFKDRIALIWMIVIAQEALHFKNNILGDSTHYDSQSRSMRSLMTFFMKDIPLHKQPNIHKLVGFTLLVRKDVMVDFFKQFDKNLIEHGETFGFVMMGATHAVSCGLDPQTRTWTLSDTAIIGYLEKKIAHTDIAAQAWQRLKPSHKTFRAVYINSFVHSANQMIIATKLSDFLNLNLNKMRYYSPEMLASLYAQAQQNNDRLILTSLATLHPDLPIDNLYECLKKMFKIEDVYLHVLQHHIDDIAAILECQCKDHIFSSKNVRKLVHEPKPIVSSGFYLPLYNPFSPISPYSTKKALKQ